MRGKPRKHQFRDATKKVEEAETMQDNAPAMQDNGETMQDKAEKKKHAPKVVPEVTRVWDGMPSTYNPGMCPNCGSSRNVITKTDPADLSTRGGAIIHRLHVCKWCGTRFRSIQHINAVDVGHVAVEEPPRAEA